MRCILFYPSERLYFPTDRLRNSRLHKKGNRTIKLIARMLDKNPTMNRLLSICLVLASLFGCKKPTECDPPPTEVCRPLPPCNSPIGAEHISLDSTYFSVSVNETDPSKLVAWRMRDQMLVTYNLTNHTVTEILPVSQIAGTRWHGEWILYNRWIGGGGSGEIYKVHPDGTGNEMLTSGPARFHPIINPTGNLFMYDATGGPAILDFSGNVIRQVHPDQNINLELSDWFNDSLLLCTGNDLAQTYSLNLNTGKLTPLASNLGQDGNFIFQSPVYVGNGEFVWTSLTGLRKTNFLTGETTTVQESCNSVLFWPRFYNAATGKLLCLKSVITNKDNDPCKVMNQSKLVYMNPDGSGQSVVNFTF